MAASPFAFFRGGAAIDNALTAFAPAYANQNQTDFDEFTQTLSEGSGPAH